MSDEGMSDAELHKLVSCDHDKGCGMRYAACSCGYEQALESALPLLLARASAAERERDALREALRPFADMLDALENLGGMAKTGAWYIAESSVSGPREITFEHFHAARAALTANHSAPVVEE